MQIELNGPTTFSVGVLLHSFLLVSYQLPGAVNSKKSLERAVYFALYLMQTRNCVAHSMFQQKEQERLAQMAY